MNECLPAKLAPVRRTRMRKLNRVEQMMEHFCLNVLFVNACWIYFLSSQCIHFATSDNTLQSHADNVSIHCCFFIHLLQSSSFIARGIKSLMLSGGAPFPDSVWGWPSRLEANCDSDVGVVVRGHFTHDVHVLPASKSWKLLAPLVNRPFRGRVVEKTPWMMISPFLFFRRSLNV